jgi:opacity protein-like surface antigen
MKRLLFIFLIPGFIYSQGNLHTVKLGYYNPSAADGGFIVGYENLNVIDENFRVGWSFDWFNKNYVDKALVDKFQDVDPNPIGGETNRLRAKTNLHDIPFLLTINGEFPVGYKTKVYGAAGVGAEVLMIFYRNYENPDQDDLKFAFDFSWRLGTGAAYQISGRTQLIGELGYHSSKPSWTYEVEEGNTKKTFERIYGMNGLLVRVGLRFQF